MEHHSTKGILAQKKKILEERAPGLFEFLTRITQGETSTEATSIHSENDMEDEDKHKSSAFTLVKSYKQSPEVNLSNIVKSPGNLSNISLPLPFNPPSSIQPSSAQPFSSNLEEIQRQKILQIVTQNSFMLNNVLAQQEVNKQRLRHCMENLKIFKNQLHESQKTHVERIEQLKEKKRSAVQDNNPSGKALFEHLFGSRSVYKYELVLISEIPNPIFKERNLVIKVELRDIASQEIIKNQNKILLQLGLQTWEIPSNPILRNKTGNKAIMGETEIELKGGEAIFERLQINEVTSKFIHGHVAMVIVPTRPINYGTSLMDHSQDKDWINFEEIKPLMLEKITVKSKKKKKTTVKEEDSANN